MSDESLFIHCVYDCVCVMCVCVLVYMYVRGAIYSLI